MPYVFYPSDAKTVEAEADETLLKVALRAGIPQAHACGGQARCSTCRVWILEGLEHCIPRNVLEQTLAESLHFSAEIRLACQTTISGDVKLRRLVLDEDDMALTDQRGAGARSSAVGEEKQLAILFADIRGFTPFAEVLPPYDVVHVLNRYFHRVGQAISRHGGHIDNYMGDGLLALFGLEQPNGAVLQAVKAGLEMLEAVAGLRPYLEATYTRSFEIGIGIHYGKAVVGAIGAAESKRMTVIGDAVNLASRIEAANKQAGTRFLLSEDTYNAVREEVRVGKSLRVILPGKSGEYTLYEVLGLNDRSS
jgi:adenylate cyclase